MKKLKTIIWFIITISIIISSSFLINKFWGTKPEKIKISKSLIINSDMTINEFGKKNHIPNSSLKKIFNLKSKSELNNKIIDYYPEDTQSIINKKLALISEESSKNWIKIIVKFIAWLAFLIFIFLFLNKKKVSATVRNILQIIAIITFGIILGSDPSPMGTVKDAVYLLGSAKTIFPPRMIAFAVFILMIVLANKYICSWGCQAGVLQDYIFRMNRNIKHNPVIWKQLKLPFIASNSIRIAVFIGLILFSVIWSFDIIETVDIFKIFNPAHLGIAGIIFSGIILISSLFIYRPWCHMICPFGLVGWIFEKISIVKINVNYDTCIACNKCVSACPTNVMSAILFRNKKVIPDCFACYTCRDICPTDSIHFSVKKRSKPLPGKFSRK